LDGKYGWLGSHPAYVSWKHEDDKVIVFERAGLVFVVNLHAQKSFADYKVGVWEEGVYQPVLDTDDPKFMGQGRVNREGKHHTFPEG